MEKKLDVKEIKIKLKNMDFSDFTTDKPTVVANFLLVPPLPFKVTNETKYFLSDEIRVIKCDGEERVEVKRTNNKYHNIDELIGIIYLERTKIWVLEETRFRLSNFIGE